MSPSAKILSPRKRLTREESKALTRRRLIDVGRKHILRDGLGNAVAERIAEEAGYSRGAFYGNFEDKEDLFLAILLQDQEQQYSLFRAIFDRNSNPKVLVKEMRDAFATRVTNGEWVFLQAEFEAGALRSEKMKALYAEMHRHMLREGLEIARRLAKAPKVRMLLKPADLMITMISLSQGLAVNQRLLGNDLSESNTRKLIREIFDQFISVDD
ncbi:MAG: TetR/AcrR family transcriptional regulator [Edaphobacter sp.]|uniref:TetR/AcrR family transcriptional regulator n=1 Tax=Edaphobacter sp. TaxID=1934404 RepID=UPI0023840242|nr:TetR/AcrR family transcriptional regulator [Edaphobacter sp.]MDE1177530.1 TetR/AcrR family transcriptional regulator [Edaphobacter sp.]